MPEWWPNTWSDWGAVGQWAGALATTAAVVIALREVFTRDRIPLVVSVAQQGTGFGSAIELRMVNMGPFPIIVEEYGIVLPNDHVLDRRALYSITHEVISNIPLNPRIPHVIRLWAGLLASTLEEDHLTGVVRLSAYVADPTHRHHSVEWEFDTENWTARQLHPRWAVWRRS